MKKPKGQRQRERDREGETDGKGDTGKKTDRLGKKCKNNQRGHI